MIQTSYYLINDNCIELNIPEYIDEEVVYKAYIADCPYLTSITVPKWIEVIEIADCPLLKEIDVSDDNNTYYSINGVMYDKSILYPLYTAVFRDFHAFFRLYSAFIVFDIFLVKLH